MKIINSMSLISSDRAVKCPNGGFISIRMLLEKDGMGYTVTRTIVNPIGIQKWHYKNHLESCYCIEGNARIRSKNGEWFNIYPGVLYVLDKNDEHYFEALRETHLICIFNPPLKGQEIHKEDGSYEI